MPMIFQISRQYTSLKHIIDHNGKLSKDDSRRISMMLAEPGHLEAFEQEGWNFDSFKPKPKVEKFYYPFANTWASLRSSPPTTEEADKIVKKINSFDNEQPLDTPKE
jgi:hypothetical protein